MKDTGVRRFLVLVAAFALAFACLADVAHAGDGEGDGCPQGKLEAQRSPLSLDSAVIPDRVEVEPDEPTALAAGVHADGSVAAPAVVARRSAPRAPPFA